MPDLTPAGECREAALRLRADWFEDRALLVEKSLHEATADISCCTTPGACSGHPGVLTCGQRGEPFPDYCHCWDTPLEGARSILGTREADRA